MSSSFKLPKEKEPYFPVGVKVAVFKSSELGRIVHPPGATATLETNDSLQGGYPVCKLGSVCLPLW